MELPVAAKWLARVPGVDAVIVLGVVIRGDTPHFEFVASGATRGCMAVMLETDVPVVFGLLTTDDEEQAEVRARRDKGNKGLEFAETAIEQALLRRRLVRRQA